MDISDFCIKHPIFSVVISLMLITIGSIFFNRLELRDIPDIAPPVISVRSVYDGADAMYIEKQITSRIEKVLKNIKNLDYVTSESADGISTITMSFKLDTDIEVALNDVRSKISAISSVLPQDMPAPSVSKLDFDNFASMWIVVNSNKHDSLELTRIIDQKIKSYIEKLPEVGSANIFGARYYTMLIEPDPVKLYQHNISALDIEKAIKAQNKDYPVGVMRTDDRNFSLRLESSLNSVEEFKNIIVKQYENGTFVKIHDIANVSLSPAENNVILRYNGDQSIAVGVVRQSTSNIIELSDSVQKELEKIRQHLPDGMKITVAYDAAIALRASISAIFITIVEAVCLVSVVIYFFLGNVRLAIIPIVTIPISLIATFAAMYFCHFSINSFTLLAMTLAIGLVVDDAIVVLENIYRHKKIFRKSAIESASSGTKEIKFAIIAMTITLVSVFFPIGFIDGFIGKLFTEFAWTLAFCVLFSGVVALTLTPMMSAKMINDTNSKKPVYIKYFFLKMNQLERKYKQTLTFFINTKLLFISSSLISVVVLVASLVFVKKEFAPMEDNGFLQVFYTGPEGSSVKQSEKVVIEAEQILMNHKDIFGFFEVIGSDNLGETAMAFVPLKDWSLRKKIAQTIQQELNSKFANIPGMSIIAVSPGFMSSGNSKTVEFNVVSSLSYKQLQEAVNSIAKLMNDSKIFQNVDIDFKAATPALDIIIDRNKLYLYNLTINDVGHSIQTVISGKKISDFRMGDEIYDVILRYNTNHRSSISDINSIVIKSPTSSDMIPIESVSNIVEKVTIKEYKHYNNSKSITISANLQNNSSLDDALSYLNKEVRNAIDLNTTSIEYIGEIKRMQQSYSDILFTFCLALIFIYLVLSAQFESFLDSFLILMIVPFSIVGGVAMLVLFGNSINMYSNIGLITLIGLVTKNSIMIVEFADSLLLEGIKIKEATIKAASLRFRPILMTSSATILGAFPLVFASGAGSGARNSIGIVIVGGMIVGTVFSLFVIPFLYSKLKKDRIILV